MASKSRLRPLARAVMRTQSDDRLVALARDGHDAAFAEIVRRYRPPLVAFASAYVAADLAEDVVQESLENSWKSMLKSQAEINLKPWLYTIVRNRALNAKRDAHPHAPIEDEVAGARPAHEVAFERDHLDRALAAIAALGPTQRRALVASAFEGRTHDQIAAALETSPASVRGLIHRARSAVRDGVGLLLPLPLVRALSEVASDPAAAESAVGAATAGVAGAGMVAGGGITGKAVTLVAVATVAAGAGVVVEESLRDEDRSARAVQERDRAERGGSAHRPGSAPALGAETRAADNAGPAAISGPSEDSGPSENSGPGSDDDSSGSGPAGERDEAEAPDDDDGGVELDDDNSGPGSINSGSGSTNSGSGSGDDDFSNSGSSGSGSSGSGSSGSGSSGVSSDEPGLDVSSSGSGSGEESELEPDEVELEDSGGSG